MPILIGLTLIIIVFIHFSKSRAKNTKKNSAEFWKKERESQFVPRKDISSLNYITIPYASLPFRYWTPGDRNPVPMGSSGSVTAPTDFSDDSGDFTVVSDHVPDKESLDTLLADVSSSDALPSDSSYNRPPEHTAPLAEELANTEHELCKLADSKILNLTGLSNTELRLTYGTANLDPLISYDHNFTVLIRTLQKWGAQLTSAGRPEDAVIVLSYAVEIGSDIAGTYALLARLYKTQGNLQKIEELKASAEELTTLMKPSILRDLDKIAEEA